MSEKDAEIVQAFLQELVEIINEKPALAKRLVEAIEYRLVNVGLDPLAVQQRLGREALRGQLKEMTSEQLRIVIKQHHIPCQNLGKRKKNDLVEVISKYAANTDIGAGRAADAAA